MHTDTHSLIHSLSHTLMQLHTDSGWHTFIYAVNQQKAASSAALALQASHPLGGSHIHMQAHKYMYTSYYFYSLLFAVCTFLSRFHSLSLWNILLLFTACCSSTSAQLSPAHIAQIMLLSVQFCCIPLLPLPSALKLQGQSAATPKNNCKKSHCTSHLWLRLAGIGDRDGEAATPFKCFMISGWDERNANVDAVKRFTVPCFYIPSLPPATSFHLTPNGV